MHSKYFCVLYFFSSLQKIENSKLVAHIPLRGTRLVRDQTHVGKAIRMSIQGDAYT